MRDRRQERERERGTSTERGYGVAHKRLRAKWATVVDTGNAYCSRCGRLIIPGSPWHLDHTDDRSGYYGPAHQRCNVAAANKRRARKNKIKRTSREW